MTTFLYPMLVSNSVNPNILPGVSKSLEKYLIINRMDELLRLVRQKSYVDNKGRVVIKEWENADSEFILMEDDEERDLTTLIDLLEAKSGTLIKTKKPNPEMTQAISQITINCDRAKVGLETKRRVELAPFELQVKDRDASPPDKRYANNQIAIINKKYDRLIATLEANCEKKKTKIQIQIDNIEKEKDAEAKRLEKQEKKQEKAQDEAKKKREEKERRGAFQASVSSVNSDSFALEPTYITADTPIGKTIIGVKVVPFIIQANGTLAELLLSYKNLNFIEGLIRKYTDSLSKTVLRILNKASFGFLGRPKSLTGNPKHDIIMSRTEFKDRVFAAVSITELDDTFFQSAGGIKKLFGFGFKTIVIDDPINKQVFIVPPEFKGTYSTVPYSFLYIGTSGGDAFRDMEDIKSSSGPLFKRKGRTISMLGKALASEKLQKYKSRMKPKTTLNRESDNSLSEGFVEDMKDKTIGHLKASIDKIQKAIVKKDKRELDKITKMIPKHMAKISYAEQYATKKFGKEFQNNYKYSQLVMKNTVPNHPEPLRKMLSLVISVTSLVTPNPKLTMKNNLKKSISILESSTDNMDTVSDPSQSTSDTKSKGIKVDVELIFAYLLSISGVLASTIAIVYSANAVTLLLAGIPHVLSSMLVSLFIVAGLIIVLSVIEKKMPISGGTPYDKIT